jgi:hypothetical protein
MSLLEKIESSLPAEWYFDPVHHQQELDAI